jgi:chromosome segregation ATPase
MNEIRFNQMKNSFETFKTLASPGSNGGSHHSTVEYTAFVEHLQNVLECQKDLYDRIDESDRNTNEKLNEIKEHYGKTDLQILSLRKDLSAHIKSEEKVAENIESIKDSLQNCNNGLVVRVNKIEADRQWEAEQEECRDMKEEKKVVLEMETKKNRNWQLIMIGVIFAIILGDKAYPYLIKILSFL